MTLTTHHVVKLSDLMDRASSEARVYRRCATNAFRIGNRNAERHFDEQALKWDRVFRQASKRLRAGM